VCVCVCVCVRARVPVFENNCKTEELKEAVKWLGGGGILFLRTREAIFRPVARPGVSSARHRLDV
jgi:hypothetical protein